MKLKTFSGPFPWIRMRNETIQHHIRTIPFLSLDGDEECECEKCWDQWIHGKFLVHCRCLCNCSFASPFVPSFTCSHLGLFNSHERLSSALLKTHCRIEQSSIFFCVIFTLFSLPSPSILSCMCFCSHSSSPPLASVILRISTSTGPCIYSWRKTRVSLLNCFVRLDTLLADWTKVISSENGVAG